MKSSFLTFLICIIRYPETVGKQTVSGLVMSAVGDVLESVRVLLSWLERTPFQLGPQFLKVIYLLFRSYASPPWWYLWCSYLICQLDRAMVWFALRTAVWALPRWQEGDSFRLLFFFLCLYLLYLSRYC